MDSSNKSRVVEYKTKDCRHGRFIYNPRDQYIGRSLELYGEYSEIEAKLLLDVIGQFTEGAVVVEAGANIGSLTVPMARHMGPSGVLLAFEPQRLIFQLLCANLALNGLTNVVTHWAGLGKEAGETIVPILDPSIDLNFGSLSIDGRWESGDRVPVMALDDIKLAKLDMLKVDVEGMEELLLEGAEVTIQRCRPVLFIENDRAEKSPTLIAAVMSLGYNAWWHISPMFWVNNYTGNSDNVFGHVHSFNMLCLPKGHRAHVDGLIEVMTGDTPDKAWKRYVELRRHSRNRN